MSLYREISSTTWVSGAYAEVLVRLAALAVAQQPAVFEVRDARAVVDCFSAEDAPPLEHHEELDELALGGLYDFVPLVEEAFLVHRPLADLG